MDKGRHAPKNRVGMVVIAGVAVFGLALAFLAVFAMQRAGPVAAPSAIASTPGSSAPAQLLTAQDYLAQGDYDFDRSNYAAAIADYSHALELKPDFAEAYNNRAYTYMTIQDYDRALSDLDNAIRLRPDYVHALMNRGDIYNYYYHIDRALAIADYDRVLAIDPHAASDTSVCGHRLLAQHNGWDLAVFVELITHGIDSGCTSDSPAY